MSQRVTRSKYKAANADCVNSDFILSSQESRPSQSSSSSPSLDSCVKQPRRKRKVAEISQHQQESSAAEQLGSSEVQNSDSVVILKTLEGAKSIEYPAASKRDFILMSRLVRFAAKQHPELTAHEMAVRGMRFCLNDANDPVERLDWNADQVPSEAFAAMKEAERYVALAQSKAVEENVVDGIGSDRLDVASAETSRLDTHAETDAASMHSSQDREHDSFTGASRFPSSVNTISELSVPQERHSQKNVEELTAIAVFDDTSLPPHSQTL
eukprot:ANDGO_03982.mRNA.1 hypothetical protein